MDILAWAFMLYLLGSSLFSSVDSIVHLGFLQALEDLDVTSHYDWGGVGLATLYGYIEGIAHGLITRFEGFYHIWEVWSNVSLFPCLFHLKLIIDILISADVAL